MLSKKSLLAVTFFLFSFISFSLTWDEPWQEEILQKSDYFILGKVVDARSGSVKIKVLRQFGEKKTESEIMLEGFHMLNICSRTDSENVSFYFDMIDSVYLFLKKTEIGYCLPTPTSGFAIVTNGKVLSTFRHSYHQAHLNITTYENCMRYIWACCKNSAKDEKFFKQFIESNLSKKPAGFSEKEIDLFFKQHAALEILFHSRDENYFNLITPFLNCSNNHLVISAVRCLGNIKTKESIKFLLDIIANESRDNFTKSLAVLSLKKLNPSSEKKLLAELIKTASDTEVGFGGNLMDPRVCTSLPSVKSALEDLVAVLKD